MIGNYLKLSQLISAQNSESQLRSTFDADGTSFIYLKQLTKTVERFMSEFVASKSYIYTSTDELS